MTEVKFKTADEYIALFPEDVQTALRDMYMLVKQAAPPEAAERISYQMPTLYYRGNPVHFAAHARHIGFYPGSGAVAYFEDKLKQYKHAKGSVQFPLGKPLPADLITEMVRFSAAENEAAAAKKKAKRSK